MKNKRRIIESPENDAEMAEQASRAAILVSGAIYGGLVADYFIEIDGYGEFLVYDFHSLGLDKAFPEVTAFAVMLGEKEPKSIGLSGAYWCFDDAPLLGKYLHAISIRGLKELRDRAASTFVNSTQFLSVFEHEFIHLLDALRTNRAMTGRMIPDPATDQDGYFNDPAEFNAFFHNLSSSFTAIISAGKRGEAALYAELDGFTGDFNKDVAAMASGYSSTILRRFVKALRSDRRKAMLRRLYKLHQLAVQTIRNDTAPDRD